MTEPDSTNRADDRDLAPFLAARIVGGDMRAWQLLYDTHFEQLFRYVYYRIGQDTHEAEDMVQEIFKELPASLANFDGEKGSLHAWLVGIARRKLSRYYAHKRRRGARMLTFSATDLARTVEAFDKRRLTEVELSHQELLKFVRIALSELPPHHARILMDKYAREMTVKDIARELGKSEHATESLLARARGALREAFHRLRNAYFQELENGGKSP